MLTERVKLPSMVWEMIREKIVLLAKGIHNCDLCNIVMLSVFHNYKILEPCDICTSVLKKNQ